MCQQHANTLYESPQLTKELRRHLSRSHGPILVDPFPGQPLLQ